MNEANALFEWLTGFLSTLTANRGTLIKIEERLEALEAAETANRADIDQFKIAIAEILILLGKILAAVDIAPPPDRTLAGTVDAPVPK